MHGQKKHKVGNMFGNNISPQKTNGPKFNCLPLSLNS